MNYVSTILQGGLGNYMFQIAATYVYGKKHNKTIGFNCSESISVHKHVTEYERNVLKNVHLYFVGKPDRLIQHTEQGFHYQEIPKYDSSVLLYGYFQTEKYFKEYENEIRNLFMSYQIEIDDEMKSIFEINNTCSVHVRRGDFLKLPNHHPTQSIEYYNKAIEQMPDDSIFLIFSDDIEWCKNNFPNEPDRFKFIEGKEDYEDLYLMSHCNNNIICNSTFSWWGAWLNNNVNKIVVAPKNWFGVAYTQYNTIDLYCDNWIKL